MPFKNQNTFHPKRSFGETGVLSFEAVVSTKTPLFLIESLVAVPLPFSILPHDGPLPKYHANMFKVVGKRLVCMTTMLVAVFGIANRTSYNYCA